MEPDVLAQLRDIHLPVDPTWWPPAPGWWLLSLGLIVLAWFGCVRLRSWIVRRRPLKRARVLYAELYQSFREQALGEEAFVHQSNEILKRLRIHSLGVQAATPASDQNWLALLDAQYGGTEFTQGPGQALGIERFRPHPKVDIDELHRLLEEFFQRIRP